MIFRPITDEITGVTRSIGVLGLSLKDTRNIMQKIKSQGLINILFNNSSIDEAAIDRYNQKILAGTPVQEALASASRGTNKATIALMESADGATVSTEALTAAQKSSTLAAKADSVALKALALAGNMIAMWGIITAVKFLANALDNAADSLEDVKARIQDNQTALSNYTSKVEELTKRLEELNQTDVTCLSEDERKELETQAAYINSQLELYNQLADAKQKAINDDYIKATMGVNQEIAYKKIWEELNEGDWGDLYSALDEASKNKWYDYLLQIPITHAFAMVDDGNYITEADKLLNEYQKLQNKYATLKQIAIKTGDNESIEQSIEKTQSQMHQTAAELSEYIEQIQTARDALSNSVNKDDYADAITEMDEVIDNYQKIITGNVYASKYLGISDVQRDLIGIRDVFRVISQDTGASAIFDPVIEQVNGLITVVERLENIIELYKNYSFAELLEFDKIFLADKLSELQERLNHFKEELIDSEFLDKLKTTLSDSIPPELVENWENFQNTIKTDNILENYTILCRICIERNMCSQKIRLLYRVHN